MKRSVCFALALVFLAARPAPAESPYDMGGPLTRFPLDHP